MVVRRLLVLLRQYDVSATWVIVGRLLETCDEPERRDAALWIGRDDVAQIREATPHQDIGSHTFEHIYYDDVSASEARADLQQARETHDQNGLPFVSFVFPRNVVGHLDVLATSGVRVFRSVDQGLHMDIRRGFGRWPGRAANLLDKLLPFPAALVHPIHHANGLVELPSSMLLLGRRGLRRFVPPRLVVAKARASLRRASHEGGMFHLWFHPSNFYHETETQFGILESILAEAAKLRDQGRLAIKPMSDFAHLDAAE
jgi:hypothetical protein